MAVVRIGKLVGGDELRNELVLLTKRIQTDLPLRMSRAGLILAGSIQKQIRGNRSRAKRKGRESGLYRKVPIRTKGGKISRTKEGRVRKTYKRRGPLPEHVLGIDTGHLRKSIGAKVKDGVNKFTVKRLFIGAEYTLELGTQVRYAMIHEYGGKIRVRPWGRGKKITITMPKRPYFAPGYKKGLPRALREFGRIRRIIT